MTKALLYSVSVLQFAFSNVVNAQCVVLPNAIINPVTLQDSSGTNNRSGLAFNPYVSIYYSVNAGSSGYPIDAFDITGAVLARVAPQGNDYRGLWWNDSLLQVEGNSFGSGPLVYQNVNASGIPLGTVTQVFTNVSQPDGQSCGVYDPLNRWVLFYNIGLLYKFDRYTNASAGTVTITGLPSTTVNSTSLIYTGCAGLEIGLYDYMQSKIYFVNEATGAYVSQCQLPPTSTSNDRFRFAFANNYVWIFDPISLLWQSFTVFQPSGIAEEEKTTTNVFPNPARENVMFTFNHFLTDAEIKITDVSGKTIRHLKNISGKSLSLKRDNLPSGIYFYTLSNNAADFLHGKFIFE